MSFSRVRPAGRNLLAAAAVISLLSAPALADEPVVDAAALKAWFTQANQMTQTITQLESQLRAMTDIPQDLVSAVQGLMSEAVQNPLAAIEQNLQTLLKGSGPGSCGNSQVYLTSNVYTMPQGTDFASQNMAQTANRNAGLQACTQQMVVATQSAMSALPGLLAQLQGAQDVTQATAISGRIQYEIANIQIQQQQAALMAGSGLLQSQMAQDQVLQKQRADAEEGMRNTAPGAASGVIPAVTQAPAPFSGT